MIVIKRKLKTGTQHFSIYTQKEADKRDVKYKYWSECYAGDFGISDDGYVGECLSRSKYRSGTFIKMSYGANWMNKSAKIDFEKNHFLNTYSMTNPAHWLDKEVKTRRFNNTMDAYIAQLMSDKQVDWNILGNIYRPDQQEPAITVRRLFKEEKVQTMVKEELKKVLIDKGISESFVLDTILEAIDIAKLKQDPSNLLKASSELSEYLQMKPNKSIQTDRIEIDVSKQIEDTILKEDKKLVMERVSEKQSDELV